jgi:hypothetical protein
VRIEEALLNEAKAYAAQNGRSLNSVMEDALRQLLNRSTRQADRPRVELPISHAEPGIPQWVEARLNAGESWTSIAGHVEDDEWIKEMARDASR